MDREKLMEDWDYWRKRISEGDHSSSPRDWFESILDYFEDERISHAQEATNEIGNIYLRVKFDDKFHVKDFEDEIYPIIAKHISLSLVDARELIMELKNKVCELKDELRHD